MRMGEIISRAKLYSNARLYCNPALRNLQPGGEPSRTSTVRVDRVAEFSRGVIKPDGPDGMEEWVDRSGTVVLSGKTEMIGLP